MPRPFADQVWVATRPARFLGVECGSRMTVVRLSGGCLLIHSPVALDRDTRTKVEALGEVRAVVAPSLFHHLHLPGWMAAYPDALFAACPGLEHKRPELAFDQVLGDQALPAWADEVEQVYFSARRENEVVLFHRASRTMICADALLHLSEHPSTATRMAARLMGNHAPGLGRLEPFMVRDRRLARRQVDRMLGWDIERIVLAHGGLIDSDGREVLRRGYAWL